MMKQIQKIQLEADMKFKNEWLITKANPSEVSQVLTIGSRVFLETQEIMMEAHLKDTEEEKYGLIEEKNNKELKELKENYENKIETMIKKHIQEIEIHYSGLLDENKNLKDKIYEREDKLRKEYDEKERELRKDLIKFKDIYTFSDNSKKGDVGEKNISIRLQKLYPNSEVKDIHKVDDSGDLWIKYAEDNCTILVESKMKKEIKKGDDLEKFKKDIIENTNNVDCGIFVSLLPASIPKLGDMHLTIINDKYVGYITDVFNEPSKLPLMIKVLRHLNKMSKNNNLSSTSEILKEANKFLDKTLTYTNLIEDLKKSNENMLNLLNNNSKNIIEFESKVKKDIREMDDYLQDNNVRCITEHSYKGILNEIEYVRQKIREYISKHCKHPSMKEITKITGYNSSKISKLGGKNYLIEISQ